MKKYIFMALTCIMIFVLCGSVSATVMPDNNYANLEVVNDNGARIDTFGNDTYNFFNGPTSTSGLNSLKINDDNGTGAEVLNTNAQSGTFYIVTTGGQGRVDDGILMLAINGTLPSNFRININASGYTWAYAPAYIPLQSDLTYNAQTLSETFDTSDLIYGPQKWKPHYSENYPIYEKQDMSSSNTFNIMLIDLYSGILVGANYNGLTNNGAIKVDYSFENLPLGSAAIFNAFGYSSTPEVGSTEGSVQWTNRVNTAVQSLTGVSGYTVNGITPYRADLVTSIQAPSNPQVGQTYTMSYTVTNLGGDAGPFTAWIYYNGKKLNQQTIDSLLAGANRVITFDWIPTTAGTYIFSARSDVYGTAIESSEKNNADTATVIVAPSKPDLVTSIQVPSNPQVGQTYTMSYTVTNNGSDTGPFTAWIYCNGKLLNKTVISSLAAGANQIITFDWTPTTAGTYTFSARSDVYAQVAESNEKNNAATQTLIVV